jgi:TrmH family RNA methyltransferase
MFPLSKLGELPPKTRLRKVVRILQGFEVDAAGGIAPDTAYLDGLLRLFDDRLARGVQSELAALRGALEATGRSVDLPRAINALRHGILRALHAEPAEWDLVNPGTGSLDRTGVTVLPMTVYVEDIRSPFNVGSIFRTAEAFGAERILLSPRTPLPTHSRAMRTSLGTSCTVPWEVTEVSALEASTSVFALETGGTPVSAFAFPRRGVVLVGSEELGLSPEALSLADQGLGRVTIPLGGAKRSLNVSVAFGILMHAWSEFLGRG